MPATSEAAKKHNRLLHHELYEWYKDHGICPGCRKAWADPGKVYCGPCYRKRQYSNERSDPGRVKRNAYDKERKARLKAEGICVGCGKKPAMEGRLKCQKCQTKQNESNKAWRVRERIRREADRAREGKGC